MDNKQKSREYWEKRARENENKVYKKAGDLKKDLDEHYIKARREIQKSINDLVARYMDKTELSYVEAMKNLTSSEFKEWKMTLEEYEKEIDRLFKAGEEELANKLRIELETLAMKSRITRLDSLKTQIDIELNRKASRDYDVVKKGISDVYRDFYAINTTDFGLTGVNTVLPNKVLRRLLNQPWSGANFSERIWGNAEILGKVLKQEIIQSFIQGISVKDLSDRIQNRFETDRKNTERLVRTELNHALNETTKLSYEEAEIEEYEYLAEIDSRTSDICRELNGQKFKMKDAKAGVNYPPMHPYCRSTTVPVIDYENFGKIKYSDEEIRALNNYISPASIALNEKLRNGDYLTKEDKKWIKDLDKALDKTPNFKGDLIRDVEIRDRDKLLKFLWEHKPGETIKYSQYISTSNKISYNDYANIRIYISNSSKGKNIIKFNKEETEILYKRNCSFVVKDVKYDKGKYEIILEETDE